MSLLGEFTSNSWDRFTTFIKSVLNHRIDDVFLKEYFYQGKDYNGKAVLDTIAGVFMVNASMSRLQRK